MRVDNPEALTDPDWSPHTSSRGPCLLSSHGSLTLSPFPSSVLQAAVSESGNTIESNVFEVCVLILI